jgi:hypothetical protein
MEAHSTQGTESIGMDFRPRLCYCTERAALLRAPSQHFDKGSVANKRNLRELMSVRLKNRGWSMDGLRKNEPVLIEAFHNATKSNLAESAFHGWVWVVRGLSREHSTAVLLFAKNVSLGT